MPKAAIKRTYPDTTFERAARDAGAHVVCLWETRGPKDTMVDWIVMYAVNNRPVIVHTYADNGGWDVFTSLDTNDIKLSVADALVRCQVSQ